MKNTIKTNNDLKFLNHKLYFKNMPVDQIANIKLECLKIAERTLNNATDEDQLIEAATKLANWVMSRP